MVSDNPPPSKDERSEETSRIDSDPSVVPQLGEEGVSKADFVLETGLLPSEYLLQTLEESGGKLLQQEMVKLSGWSESRISTILTEMEKQEHIVRIQLGRENVVYLPNTVPDTDVDSSNDSGTG